MLMLTGFATLLSILWMSVLDLSNSLIGGCLFWIIKLNITCSQLCRNLDIQRLHSASRNFLLNMVWSMINVVTLSPWRLRSKIFTTLVWMYFTVKCIPTTAIDTCIYSNDCTFMTIGNQTGLTPMRCRYLSKFLQWLLDELQASKWLPIFWWPELQKSATVARNSSCFIRIASKWLYKELMKF